MRGTRQFKGRQLHQNRPEGQRWIPRPMPGNHLWEIYTIAQGVNGPPYEIEICSLIRPDQARDLARLHNAALDNERAQADRHLEAQLALAYANGRPRIHH